MSVLAFPMVGGNRVELLNNGDQIFGAMIRDINEAKASVNLETFILRSDDAGEPVMNALIAAANRGVEVRLLIDAVGSKVKHKDIKRMEEAGVIVKQYRPLWTFRLHRVSQRTHRKVMVVDGRVAYTGGLGFGKEWLGNARGPEEWRETQVRVEGPVASEMQAVFAENWIYTTGEVLGGDRFYPEIKPVGTVVAQAMRTAQGDASSFAKMVYYMAFESARKKIYITNPYFIPDAQIRDALRSAAKRGVDVQIILPGKNSDARFVRAASWFHYGTLLQAGVKIYEYQPTMIHAKNVVIDGVYSTVGSINFDLRSMKVNAENSFAFHDRDVAARLEAIFKADRDKCKEITYKEWKHRPIYKRLFHFAARLWEPYY